MILPSLRGTMRLFHGPCNNTLCPCTELLAGVLNTARRSPSRSKKLSLELGSNAPFIVFDDADIEMAVKGATASKYRNAGQTCVRVNRILVQDGVYDAFTKRLAETAGAMKVADGFEPGALIGPLIDNQGGREGRGRISRCRQKGRQGGRRVQARRAGKQLLPY